MSRYFNSRRNAVTVMPSVLIFLLLFMEEEIYLLFLYLLGDINSSRRAFKTIFLGHLLLLSSVVSDRNIVAMKSCIFPFSFQHLVDNNAVKSFHFTLLFLVGNHNI